MCSSDLKAKLLPTPNAAEGEKYTTKMNKNSQIGMGLTAMGMNGLLPTPIAIDGGSGRMNKSLSKGAKERPTIALMARTGLLPTPTAMDSSSATANMKSSQTKEGSMHSMTLSRFLLAPKLEKQTNGKTAQLNPRYVAEMMGFPTDWTELPFLNGEQNQ